MNDTSEQAAEAYARARRVQQWLRDPSFPGASNSPAPPPPPPLAALLQTSLHPAVSAHRKASTGWRRLSDIWDRLEAKVKTARARRAAAQEARAAAHKAGVVRKEKELKSEQQQSRARRVQPLPIVQHRPARECGGKQPTAPMHLSAMRRDRVVLPPDEPPPAADCVSRFDACAPLSGE